MIRTLELTYRSPNLRGCTDPYEKPHDFSG